ncbi:MAG: TonB-dependent receptor plug domain-containing protein [Planctomycetota bacterium]
MKTELNKSNIGIAVIFLVFISSLPLLAEESSPNNEEELFDMSLEELMEIEVGTVTTASKYEQKTTEAPSSVTVITAEEVRMHNYKTLADVLRSVKGFYTSYDRSYERVGVRGFNLPGDVSSRTLILVDGVRMNENVQNFGAIGEGFILDVDLIKRIEIIRGPGSSLYGSNAIFGVINIITKKGADYDGFEIAGDLYGYENSLRDWDTGRARVTFGKEFESGLDFLLSASWYDRDSIDLWIPHFSELEELGPTDSDDEDTYKFFSKLIFDEFTLEGAYSSRDKQIPTAPLGVVFEPAWKSTKEDDAGFLALTWEHDLTETISMKARTSYNYYKHEFTGQYTGEPFDDVNGFFLAPTTYKKKGQWWNSELQFTADIWENHKLTWGFEFQYNDKQDQEMTVRWNDSGDITVDPNESWKKNERNHWYGFYVQDEIRFAEDLMVNLGVRYDYYEGAGDNISPRVAVIKNLSDKTTLKLLYGTAFRAPTAYELYYHNPPLESFEPAGKLDSEEIETYEAVLEHYFNPSMRGSFSLYYYKLEDYIAQQSAEGWPPGMLEWDNRGDVEALGLEAGLEKYWANGTKGRFSYSFVDTDHKETQYDEFGDPFSNNTNLPNSPEHMLKGNLIVPLIENKLFAGIESQYYSKRKVQSTVPEFDRNRGDHTDGYFITNITLTWQDVVKNLELAFSVRNLFDEEYWHPAWGDNELSAIQQDGRTYILTARYRF